MNIYLDIDGVLLGYNRKPAQGAHEFLCYVLAHYQKIIVALTETGRIMKEIDKVK